MRVPPDQFLVEAFDHVVEGERALFLPDLYLEHDLQEQIAEFLLVFVGVPGIDGIE